MTPLAYFQQSAERLCDAIDRKAERHIVESAAAIVRDALAATRRTRGRPKKIDAEAIRSAAKKMTVAEMVAAGLGSDTSIRRILKK